MTGQPRRPASRPNGSTLPRSEFGTRAADAGVPLNAIRDVRGHKTTLMTERYAHATDEGKRKAVEATQLESNSKGSEKNCHKFATISDRKAGRKVVND